MVAINNDNRWLGNRSPSNLILATQQVVDFVGFVVILQKICKNSQGWEIQDFGVNEKHFNYNGIICQGKYSVDL